MYFDFKKDSWDGSSLTHAFSHRFKPTPEFIQEETCIANPKAPSDSTGYSYISLVTKEKVKPGTKITVHCDFEEAAAPLIVLAKDLEDADGVKRYADCQEIVLWKNGLNVWDIWREADGSIKWVKLLGITTPLEAGKIHALSVEIKADRYEITLNDMKISLQVRNIFPEFHLGLTGCEGSCRFYDMTID